MKSLRMINGLFIVMVTSAIFFVANGSTMALAVILLCALIIFGLVITSAQNPRKGELYDPEEESDEGPNAERVHPHRGHVIPIDRTRPSVSPHPHRTSLPLHSGDLHPGTPRGRTSGRR